MNIAKRKAVSKEYPAIFFTNEQMTKALHLEDETALIELSRVDVRFPVPVDVAGQPCWIISEVQRWAKKLDCYRFEDV